MFWNYHEREPGEFDFTSRNHDIAQFIVFLNSEYVGKLDRREGESTIDLPKSSAKDPLLEILVEAMGRINFAQYMIDRKGITDRVTLNGMTLMNWEVVRLPFDASYIQSLRPGTTSQNRQGMFFRAEFNVDEVADTCIDMTNYRKGIVWINHHNLGRYWDIGPQKRLYCPAPWLKRGQNESLIFDLHQLEPKSVRGVDTLY